jgi:hypothetical protein
MEAKAQQMRHNLSMGPGPGLGGLGSSSSMPRPMDMDTGALGGGRGCVSRAVALLAGLAAVVPR